MSRRSSPSFAVGGADRPLSPETEAAIARMIAAAAVKLVDIAAARVADRTARRRLS